MNLTLTVVEQKLVPFGDYEILAVKTNDGKIRAAVKWICKGIGLTDDQAKRQVKNIQTDLVVSRSVSNLTLNTNAGLRDVMCIELDFLPLWLAKISITPSMQETNPEAVENLVNYQLKAKDVLADAFLSKQQPTTAELIAMMAQQGVEQERRLNAVEEKQLQLETKQDNIAEIIALNPTEWRKKVTNLINKIALSRGGFEAYRNVRNESYQILEERGRCKLDIRLSNRRKEMALNGISKSKLDKVTKLDVIAEDARLTEIYLAIVKEMAIKHQIKVEGMGA
ncbi:phage antirepressor N-terminal domain-containing protein [Lysinibacillus pakistanensis]|uniref:phage antirepressor N-terminal domain-containing protein n=1 Tax=Lysinibacillus pakistanensis TaxID=759811 RepID=UPI003D29F599